jgi:peptidoglycan-associated lipoprotein
VEPEETMKKVLFVALPILALPLLAACGSDKKPPQTANTAKTEPTTTQTTSAPGKPEQMAVNVSDDIVKACNLKFTNIEDAPKFDFDSDQLTPGERDVLDAVAKCLTTGPLKGRAVDLVGRADPRGETEYNMTLGAKRSRTVHNFLVQLGVANDKLHDTSRGEMDATGTDEQGWKKDRRVDVKLRP